MWSLWKCLRNITANASLWKIVINMAIETNIRIPVFYQFRLTNDYIVIEIAALSPLREIKYINNIKMEKH